MTDQPGMRTFEIPQTISIGRLGATARLDCPEYLQLSAALDMAERRILRLEMALRRACIEVERLDLPR